MKTATTILLALCFSSLILSSLAAAAADTFSLTVTDKDTSNTGNFPLTYVVGTAASMTATATPATITGSIATTDAGNTVTLSYANGLPLQSTYALTTANGGSAGATSDTLLIVLSLGDRVVTVTNSQTGATSGTTKTTNTLTTVGTPSLCGDNYWDVQKGLLYFAVNAVTGPACTVTINQISAVIGVIQYNENTFSSTQMGALGTALGNIALRVSGVSGATGTVPSTASGSTLAYYNIIGSLTAAQASSVQQAVQAAIYAKTITVSGATQLNGYAKAITPSATATTSAPSSAVQANILAAYPKSHSRMVAIVGVFTTVLAAFFGLAF